MLTIASASFNEDNRPKNSWLLQFAGPKRPLAARRDEVFIGEPHVCSTRLPSRIPQCIHARREILSTENGDIMNELPRMEVRQNIYICSGASAVVEYGSLAITNNELDGIFKLPKHGPLLVLKQLSFLVGHRIKSLQGW
jgi:hypothetical protein